MTALFHYFESFQHNLSHQAKAALQSVCTTHIVQKNRDLQPIGHTCRTIYFIQKGLARVYYFKGEDRKSVV